MLSIRIRGQRKTPAALLWDLKRFGLWPSKIAWRARHGSAAKPIILCSIPKSGTHLLESILCMHPAFARRLMPTITLSNSDRFGGTDHIVHRARPGELIVTHIPRNDQLSAVARGRDAPIVFLKRDPRAVLYSMVRFVEERPDHFLHQEQANRPTLQAKVMLHLNGVPNSVIPPFADYYSSFLEWQGCEGVATFQFEHLVGARQPEEIRRLFSVANIVPAEDWLAGLPARLPTRSTPTFRSGMVDEWRRRFDASTLELIEDSIGYVIEAAGYPSGSRTEA